jgi:predicted nucleic acid-binding protein
MRFLVDTNVLCRVAEIGHPHHEVATAALLTLQRNNHELCIVPQIAYEYWVVATRPLKENGLGMSTGAVDNSVSEWRGRFTLLRDERLSFEFWRGLVSAFNVVGKPAHDERLVAAMLRHGITELLTFNSTDFSRYTQINVHTPQKTLHV